MDKKTFIEQSSSNKDLNSLDNSSNASLDGFEKLSKASIIEAGLDVSQLISESLKGDAGFMPYKAPIRGIR